jgi:hypothetical protein
MNLPNQLNQIVILKNMHFFGSKYVFLSFSMSTFDIIGNDGLVVKVLESGCKSCEFKPQFEH